MRTSSVVICLKNRTFVVLTTTDKYNNIMTGSCDLLEKSYLCGINNNGEYCDGGFLKL